MEVVFTNNSDADMCNGYPVDKHLEKRLSRLGCPASPEDILAALESLAAVCSPEELPPQFNYHLLKCGKSSLGAIDIVSKKIRGRGLWRIVFKPISNCNDINKKSSINRVEIVNLIEDYHKGKK